MVLLMTKKNNKELPKVLKQPYHLSDGLVYVDFINENLPKEFKKNEKIVFSSKFACPESGFTIEEIEPRLFSFNSPYGACPECEGIGVDLYIDPKLVIPNEKKTLIDGAIVPWASSSTLYYAQTLSSLAKHYNFSLETPWKDLPKKIQDVILYGYQEKRK
jgi:excinuclease ABC subunit A